MDKLLGGAFNLLWGSGMLVVVFLFFVFFPKGISKIDYMRQDILDSRTYALVIEPNKDKFPSWVPIERPLDMSPEGLPIEEIQKTAEFQSLMDDKRLKDLMSDKEMLELIKQKDVSKIFNNPKVQEIFQDPELMGKLMKVNKKILEIHAAQPTADKAAE